jgi:hypothetical protein
LLAQMDIIKSVKCFNPWIDSVNMGMECVHPGLFLI